MITINVIKVNEIEYLNGKIGKDNYSVVFSQELRDFLVEKSKQYNACKTKVEADAVLEAALESINSTKNSGTNSLTEALGGDLAYNPKTHSYHVVCGGKTSEKPVHDFFCKKMIEANEKGLSPKPWLVFWVRLMRNPLFVNDNKKVKNLIEYLKAQYVDHDAVKKMVEEEGYSSKVAEQLCTFDQISITEEGILAAFKYVGLVDKKFTVVKNEDGTQEIKQVDMFERVLEVDPVTGEITKDELVLPEFAEDFLFVPPIQGQNGDAFTSKAIDDDSDAPVLAHTIKVGHIHELSKGFDQVNTNDSVNCVKGLHLGGHYYVKGYGGQTNYLVDCLVAPEDIGAVCDVRGGIESTDGAIRCRRYMVVGGHFQVSKGMYHPSSYAKLIDSEWETIKSELIDELNKKIDVINAKL